MVIASEYLVNYGRTAFLGRFVNRADTAFERGERVVVQSVRGLEAGIVLREATPQFAHLVGIPSGDLLRRFADDDLIGENNNRRAAADLILDAQATADSLGLSLAVLDAEILLDASAAFLHILPLADCDPTPLSERLSRRHGFAVSFQDPRYAAAPEPTGGCGKPGCGSSSGSCGDCSSGGCSTGSCSSGKVKNAEEMTDYFVQLRQKMEREFGRVPLHV